MEGAVLVELRGRRFYRMSDIEKLRELLRSWNVPFTEEDDVVGRSGKRIQIQRDDLGDGSETVVGYTGFFTEFSFDNDGKFLSVGAWE